jgi:hypothetical protein
VPRTLIGRSLTCLRPASAVMTCMWIKVSVVPMLDARSSIKHSSHSSRAIRSSSRPLIVSAGLPQICLPSPTSSGHGT